MAAASEDGVGHGVNTGSPGDRRGGRQMDDSKQIKDIVENLGLQLNQILDIVEKEEDAFRKKIWNQSEEIKSLTQKLDEADRKFDDKEKSEEYVFKKYNMLKNAVTGAEVLESLSFEISELMTIAADPNNPVKSLKQIAKKIERNLGSLGAKVIFSEAGTPFNKEMHDAEFIDTSDSWKHMKVKGSVSVGFSFGRKKFGEEDYIKEKVTVWRDGGMKKQRSAEPVQNMNDEGEEKFYYYIVFDGDEELVGYKIKNQWSVSYDFSKYLMTPETDNIRVIITEEKDAEPLFEFRLESGFDNYTIEKLKFSLIEKRSKIEATCHYAYFNGNDIPMHDTITLTVPVEKAGGVKK